MIFDGTSVIVYGSGKRRCIAYLSMVTTRTYLSDGADPAG
jgi:hypothetical protein